jgi:hypothetical protein
LTRRDLTRVLVKVFGLLILVSAVAGLPWIINAFAVTLSVWNTAGATQTWQDVAVIAVRYLGPFVGYAALGLCLLWWSSRIIDRAGLAPEPGENDAPVASSDLRNVEISLVAVLGLYFVADGFADLCRAGLGLGLHYRAGASPTLFWNVDIAFVVGALLKLIIGIWLVLGRGGTVAVMRGARIWVGKMRTWPD